MTGAFLIGFLILAIGFFIIGYIDEYEEVWQVFGCIFAILSVGLLLAMPISRIDSKQNAEYAKVFQQTLEYNRTNDQEFDVLERTAIIEKINECNSYINGWKVKGKKWYNNKWYYHPDTQKAEFIK